MSRATPVNNQQGQDTVLEKDLSLFDKIKNVPKDVYDLATGENAKVEFPNAPETTEIEDIDFFDKLIPEVKLMFTANDAGKAEIIANSFKDDERFGGAFSDKYGNPLILWNNVPHYVNKPGFSSQDLGTFVGTLLEYYPASKYVMGGAGMLNKAVRGAFGYGATETVGEAVESSMTPETTKAKNKSLGDLATDIGATTAINVGVDAVLPMAGKLTRAITKPIVDKAKSAFPRYQPKSGIEGENLTVMPEGKSFIATKGQSEATPFDRTKSGDAQAQATEQLMKESEKRYAKTEGGDIIRGVDERQLDDIRKEADELTQVYGSGGVDGIPKTLVPLNSAEKIKNILTNRTLINKTESKALYQDANLDDLIIPREGVNILAKEALEKFNALKIGNFQLRDQTMLKRTVDDLKRLVKLSENPNFKPQSFRKLRDLQISLNNVIKDISPDKKTELKGLIEIADSFKSFVNGGIDRAFILGDQEILNQLKKANMGYKQYMGLSGQSSTKDPVERGANAILKKIVNPSLDADSVVSAFFGHSQFNPSPVMNRVLQKIRTNLPENEAQEVISLVKDGIITKAFSGAGKSGVTRTNIVFNYDDVFKKNKKLISQVFTPKEIDRINDFRERVMPTLWAEIKLNPSNSGYTIISAMARAGILNYGKVVPMAGVGLTNPQLYQGIKDVSEAKSMVGGYVNRKGKPLFSSEAINNLMKPFTAAGSITPTVTKPALEEQYQDDASSSLPKFRQTSEYDSDALDPILANLSEDAKQKIMEAI